MLINKTVSYENIYCNLFYEVNKTKLFPKNYFKQKNILYKYEKNNGSKKFILVKIEDTIHYKYLINRDANMQIYKNYVELTNQPDHSIEKFDNLIGSFSEKKLLISKIKLEKINYKLRKYYIINDGCHRLSLLKFHNINLKNDYFEIIN